MRLGGIILTSYALRHKHLFPIRKYYRSLTGGVNRLARLRQPKTYWESSEASLERSPF